MTWEQIIGLAVALLVMCIGLVGCLLPILPSTPIVFLAAVAHRFYFGPHGASNWVLAGLAGFALLAVALDHVAGVVGAQRFGATRWGMAGAAIGTIIGLMGSLPGILFGPFAGATLFEKCAGRDWNDSARAGLGATIGMLAGVMGKVALCLVMMFIFALNVTLRSGIE